MGKEGENLDSPARLSHFRLQLQHDKFVWFVESPQLLSGPPGRVTRKSFISEKREGQRSSIRRSYRLRQSSFWGALFK